MASSVSVSAASLRGLRDQLRRTGLLEAVSARLTEPTRSLLANPPMPTTYVEAARMNEVLLAIAAEGGDELVRRTAREMARSAYGTVAPRLIRWAVGLFGSGPATIFSQAQRLLGMFERGTTYRWFPEGERAGRMTVDVAEPFPPECFACWEGVFLYVFDTLNVEGRVSNAEVTPDGRSASFRLEW